MTFLGVIFILITWVCSFGQPQRLLALLIFASVFEAASVYSGNIGGFVFGISPFYFVGICIALRLMWLAFWGGKLLPAVDAPARGIAVALLAFLVWCVVSSFVMPRLFAGIPVYSPRERADMDIVLGNLEPLHWTLSNLGNGAYLTLNVCAVLFGSLVIQTTEQAEALARALRWAVFAVVAVGFLQELAVLMGWDFPYAVLSNNPGADPSALYQQFDGVIRINSTFAEPMNTGSFLAAAVSGLLATYLYRRRRRYLFAMVAAIAVLLVSTSTTGYAATAIMFVVLLVYFSLFVVREVGTRRPFLRSWVAIGVVTFCAFGLPVLFAPNLSQAVMAMTVDKPQGMSFVTRVVADLDTLRLLASTYGLGVGLGSSRPSSLVAGLLSTVGVVGTTLFAIVLYKIIKAFPGRRAPGMLHMSFWSLIGLLVADSIGVPDITRPTLWALLLVVVAQLNVHSIAASNTTHERSELS